MGKEMELVRLYNAAGRSMREMLLSIDIADFNEAKAVEIEKKARRLTAALNLAAERWIRRAVPDAYKVSERRSRTSLEILGKKPRSRHGMANSGPNSLRDAATVYLIKANASMNRIIERYLSTALLAGRTLKEIPVQVQEFSFQEAATWLSGFAARAVRQQESRGTLKHRILNYLRGLISDDNFIEIKGKMWRAGKYAEMVARTTLRDAQTKATTDLCAQYENDLVQVSDHNTICDICKPFEGNIYSLSGNDAEYPRLPEETPFHPNCEHSLLPTSVEAISARARWNQ